MPVPDAVPLRDAGGPQVLWIKGRSTADIHNEAESRMSAATYRAMRLPPRLESDT